MHRFGMISIYVGLVLSIVGLFGGFGLMFAGEQTWSKPLVAMVPLGFLLVFNGVVTTILHRPKGSRGSERPQGPPD
ncbi:MULTISPECIES: hypothetical protein [Thioalkalivibrio]|uniref:DUF3098 domain-containing protein n=1 Tax=Thioalkalivibrio halophilus TaxID=252474 RepID=A0A1V3A065_9GAMM|nr:MULTISPECIES: hypothetical protein [Thioalkalivibrio]OOC10725.1 hypothetical protein B1A74_03975 [Thioalkalivibrio halophilus]PYG04451.1 hypothetical protein D893_00247 [Thioalkalivibrio sp. ALE21]